MARYEDQFSPPQYRSGLSGVEKAVKKPKKSAARKAAQSSSQQGVEGRGLRTTQKQSRPEGSNLQEPKRPEVPKASDPDEGLTDKQKATKGIAGALYEGVDGLGASSGPGLLFARIAAGAKAGADVGAAIAKYKNQKNGASAKPSGVSAQAIGNDPNAAIRKDAAAYQKKWGPVEGLNPDGGLSNNTQVKGPERKKRLGNPSYFF